MLAVYLQLPWSEHLEAHIRVLHIPQNRFQKVWHSIALCIIRSINFKISAYSAAVNSDILTSVLREKLARYIFSSVMSQVD